MALTNSISKIPVTVYANYIVEKLHKTNPHLSAAFDESDMVKDGAVVVIPQAGNSPEVVKNRTTLPATVVQRADTQIVYPLDVFTTTPTLITWHEENEISYNKTDSVLSDHTATLMDAIGSAALYNWVHAYNASNYSDVNIPETNVIKTTGANADVAESGQTGQRKSLTWRDIQAAQVMMNKQNVPMEGRYALLESYMYQQLLSSLSQDNMMAAFQQTADLQNGVVGRLFGFTIMQRSEVVNFTSAGQPKVPGEAMSSTDNVGSLLWQRNSVAIARGEIKPFQDLESPQYYGSIFSALVKMGGRCRRSGWEGVIALVQDTAAAG